MGVHALYHNLHALAHVASGAHRHWRHRRVVSGSFIAGEENEMNEEEIRDFIASQNWRFAKTMPDDPHWYVVSYAHDKPFYDFVSHINRHGSAKLYKKVYYICFDFEGYTYWSIPVLSEDKIVLNRAELKNEKQKGGLT